MLKLCQNLSLANDAVLDLEVKGSARTPEQYEKLIVSLVRTVNQLNDKLTVKTLQQSPKPVFSIRRSS